MILPQKETLEREIKLSAPRNFSLPPLPGEPLVPRQFTSAYYDTEDHRLAQAGITLRYRTEARLGVWQLKLPRNGARRELEFSGGRVSPPESIFKLLYAHLRGRSLSRIARLRTRRSGIRVAGAEGPLADVVMDSVVALDGQHVIRYLYELEVELTGGSEADLPKIEKTLREAGAQDGDRRPKVFRVLNLELPPSAVPVPATAPPLRATRAASAVGAVPPSVAQPVRPDSSRAGSRRLATRTMRA